MKSSSWTNILFGILLVFGAGYLGHSVGVNDILYDVRLKQFKENCEAKHWKPQWRRFIGWYCSAPNSVDFYE